MTAARHLALPFAALALATLPALAGAAEIAGTVPAAPTMRVVDGARHLDERIVNGSLENFLPALAAVRDEVGTLCSGTMIGCRTLLTAATIDEKAVEQLRQKMSAHHDQLSKLHVQTLVRSAQVLTPEQRAQVAKLQQQHGRGARGPGMGMPPGGPRGEGHGEGHGEEHGHGQPAHDD